MLGPWQLPHAVVRTSSQFNLSLIFGLHVAESHKETFVDLAQFFYSRF